MASASHVLEEPEEEDYNSASDQDFNPDAPPPQDEDSDSPSSDDDHETSAAKVTKRKGDAEDLDFDNSGDEATISRGKRKKQKTNAKAHDGDDDDEGGEGGLVKTRAQRRAEVQEKKPLVQAGKATVNVEDLWAQMSAPQKPSSTTVSKAEPGSSREPAPDATGDGTPISADNILRPPSAPSTKEIETESPSGTSHPLTQQGSNGDATVTIRRTYEFAGEKMEEERIVPANSAEAKLYLEEQLRKTQSSSSETKPPLRRPKKRASMFDSGSGGLGPNFSGTSGKGPKLNTLEKSKLDWAAHVDNEGISDELEEHRRAKGGYLGRMDFLGRMDAKREDELRSIKPK